MDFLSLLRDQIREGLRAAAPEYRDRHARWLAAQQTEAGGFKNRRGNPELYYTTFGLRSLSCLDALTAPVASRAKAFLLAETTKPRHPFREAVSAVSWWDALMLAVEAGAEPLARDEHNAFAQRTAAGLDPLRRDDGGWAKTSMEGNGSLYHSFLASLTYQRMGVGIPEPERIADFAASLAEEDGGFRESRYSKRPGTNGTAAGVALTILLRAEALPAAAKKLASWTGLLEAGRRQLARGLDPHGVYMKCARGEEGGLHATPGAPIADLLSTYTGLFTMKNLDLLDAVSLRRGHDYARQMECPEGGYIGFLLEEDPDCEYTFYGLGVESLAAAATA